ncbi:hypothetical protein TNCV_1349151 [Trichonephila clavipes]|nr:hypothetical protein TNCV_1349151 [Trichonephila clavipes]
MCFKSTARFNVEHYAIPVRWQPCELAVTLLQYSKRFWRCVVKGKRFKGRCERNFTSAKHRQMLEGATGQIGSAQQSSNFAWHLGILAFQIVHFVNKLQQPLLPVYLPRCVYKVLTKYQMIKFTDFCEVGFLPESVARVATIVGDHRYHHTPWH